MKMIYGYLVKLNLKRVGLKNQTTILVSVRLDLKEIVLYLQSMMDIRTKKFPSS